MKHLLTICAFMALAACSPSGCSQQKADTTKEAETAAPVTPVKTDAPAGTYTLDKTHASLIFRLNHLGFSNYTARFATFDATIELDPAHPETAKLNAKIDANSLALENPPAGFLDALKGPDWLDTAKYPDITFKSTKVELTGANTAKITGDFTLHGVTKPVTLDATFNGGYPGFAMDPHARIGFSATATLMRSEFGIAYGVPAPGTTMGVGDEVQIHIEAEFSGPPFVAPAGAAPAPEAAH